MMPVHPAILIALGVVLVAVVLLIVLALCRAAALGDRMGHDDPYLDFEHPARIRYRQRTGR